MTMPRTCGRRPRQRRAAGLAARHVHVVDIADLADRREAGLVDLANFAGGKLDQRVTGFAVAQGGLLAGAARDLTAAARDDLDVMNRGTERDGAERERVADGRLGARRRR